MKRSQWKHSLEQRTPNRVNKNGTENPPCQLGTSYCNCYQWVKTWLRSRAGPSEESASPTCLWVSPTTLCSPCCPGPPAGHKVRRWRTDTGCRAPSRAGGGERAAPFLPQDLGHGALRTGWKGKCQPTFFFSSIFSLTHQEILTSGLRVWDAGQI